MHAELTLFQTSDNSVTYRSVSHSSGDVFSTW